MPIFQAYHDITGSAHQQRFSELFGQGYRMISLSVYGDRDQPRYAAVWIKRAGPEWFGVHGLTAAGYQAKFSEFTGKGFLPALLSVAGPPSNPIFAGTFEKGTAHAFLTRFGLTDGSETSSGTLAWANKWARQNGCMPRSIAIYGTTLVRAYAGVWLPNPERTKWAVIGPVFGEAYQTSFDSYGQLPFRPALVDSAEDYAYLAVFQDNSVGPWVARHGMTSDEYQAEFSKQRGQGNMPISVQGGGVSSIRYAAIFAKQDVAIARSWTVTGQADSALAAFDQAIKNFMAAESVRAGAFAIVKGGGVRYARAYTWAEPDYVDTQPNSLFRLASCSKAFVCAAISNLIDQNPLLAEQRVFELLGIASKALPTQTIDPRVNSITVQHLVQHEGGWDSKLSKFDAVFSMRKIALDLGLASHVSKRDIARYMFGEPLDFSPGTRSAYSNLGYVLLGLVVEQVTGRPFIDYIRDEILGPMDINDVFVGGTLREDRRPNEVAYDDPNLGKSAWNPRSEALVPYCHGGEGWVTESMDTGGGLITSAPSMARFISQHAVWGLGGRMAGAARSGGMAGVASLAVSRTDGVDWAYIFNTRTLSSGALDKLGIALDKVFAATTL